MQAEIITIGDEILIGQVIDTNSAFIAAELNSIGVSVYQITSVQDDKSHILKSLREAETNADIIIITGGLGPTKDDITKRTLAEYFDDTLVRDPAVLENIKSLWKKYVRQELAEVNIDQALIPSKSKVLMNRFGSAPGMWIEKEKKTFISLPGVPYEMRALIKNEVLPGLQARYHFPYIFHRTLLTYGLGESQLAARIETWENDLPDFIKLAYLPNFGRVRLRLSAKGPDKEQITRTVEKEIEKLMPLIADVFIGIEDNGERIEIKIGQMLKERRMTVATAESCSGGMIAKEFTSNSGASDYFKGSVVSYATQAKRDVLGLPEALISRHSVVSGEVAEAMAKSVQGLFKSDYAIATTGNAGPTKGDSDAEVGTVFIAIATPKKVYSQEFHLGNHRVKVIRKTTNKALELLYKEILKN
jgi:nicotinamide-nucleotide amidase